MNAKCQVVITAAVAVLVFESGMKSQNSSKLDLHLILACDNKASIYGISTELLKALIKSAHLI